MKKITFMVGPSGSGKSRASKSYQEAEGIDSIIDVDEFKHQLNEFKPLCKKTNAALHPEASKMAKAALESFRVAGTGWVLYDSTGKDFEKVKQRAEEFKAKGFEVEFYLVELGYINTILNVLVRNHTSNRSMLLRVVSVIWIQCKVTQIKIKRGRIPGCEVKRVQGFKRISAFSFEGSN